MFTKTSDNQIGREQGKRPPKFSKKANTNISFSNIHKVSIQHYGREQKEGNTKKSSKKPKLQ